MQPGMVWLGVSMVSWHGGGASQVVVPVFDVSVGLTPRVQAGASIPRAAGGLGTTFFTAKIGLLDSDGFRVAIGPTLEVVSSASMESGPAGQRRTQFGLPLSAQIDSIAGRIYGSAGYFSPGIWYTGAGFARPVTNRVGVSASFSHALSGASAAIPDVAGPRRNDLSGGVSFDVTPDLAIFGSLGRTIGTAPENGAGTTISFGMSLNAGPVVFMK
jgi:hypothetical protein